MKKKDKWLGHTVRIKKGVLGYGTGLRGEVVCQVKERKRIAYIVQFQDDWCYYYAKDLRLDK